MVDVFDNQAQTTTNLGLVTVVVLSDAAWPVNMRLVRDGVELQGVQRATIAVRAEAMAIGMIERLDHRPASLRIGEPYSSEEFGAIVNFQAMTSEEFERRHGCPSSTPS